LKEEIQKRKPYYRPFTYRNLTREFLLIKYEIEKQKRQLEAEGKIVTFGELYNKKKMKNL